MTTLYNLRTDGDQYRITKFTDGEVESSYLCSETECECPAGTRPTCRHRRMLPEMLTRDICNTHWFYDFDIARVVDLNGQLKSNLDAITQGFSPEMQHALKADAEKLSQITGEEHTITFIPDEPSTQPHSVMANTEDFDSSNGGSNPPAVATPELTQEDIADAVDYINGSPYLQPMRPSWRRI